MPFPFPNRPAAMSPRKISAEGRRLQNLSKKLSAALRSGKFVMRGAKYRRAVYDHFYDDYFTSGDHAYLVFNDEDSLLWFKAHMNSTDDYRQVYSQQ